MYNKQETAKYGVNNRIAYGTFVNKFNFLYQFEIFGREKHVYAIILVYLIYKYLGLFEFYYVFGLAQ